MAKQNSRKNKRRARAADDWRTRALTLRDRVVDALPAPAGELDLAIERLQTEVQERIEEIEWETEKRAQLFVRQLRTSPIAKQLQALPKQMTNGVDRLLDRVGLMRKARHEALLKRAKVRAKTPRRKSAAAAAA